MVDAKDEESLQESPNKDFVLSKDGLNSPCFPSHNYITRGNSKVFTGGGSSRP